MSISVTGLGSGLDYSSWITQLVAVKQTKIDAVSKQVAALNTQKTTLGTVQDKYKSLLTSIESFTNSISSNDVFNKKTVTSSLDAVSAAVTSSAKAQNVNVTVSQLATATTASYKNADPAKTTAASYVDSATYANAISEGTLKTGTFSVYVDGVKATINIDASSGTGNGDTMQGILDKLNNNSVEGIQASITNGKLNIQATAGHTITGVGSSTDTGNFSKVMSLVRDTDTGAYASSKSIFDTNTAGKLTAASTEFTNGTVTAGVFTIGDKHFTIDANSTLDSIINDINNSDAGATASWDSNSGKFILTSDDQGAVSINVQAGNSDDPSAVASNFTDIMGLTVSDFNPDSTLISTKLATDSQELGTNAVLTINGTTITSASNTVTSDVSGVEGLTLTLNAKTTSNAKVAISQDTAATVDAITSFVSSFNMAISESDSATSKDGKLHGESLLNSLRNGIRKTATASTSVDGIYKTLASIGITSGAVSTDPSAQTNKLTIDTEALKKAITTDPESVKKLLVGDGVHDGVMSKMTPALDNALNPVNGYFTKRTSSLTKSASTLNTKITTMNEKLTIYHDQLSAKFEAMDKMIASLKASASVFDSYFTSNSSSSSS